MLPGNGSRLVAVTARRSIAVGNIIKNVTIQGFRSYREQTIVDPFSSGHNVVVGRNGSGKSNFFSAIRFVLSDMFSNIGVEERQALLHEGTGMAVVTAFVEIAFDNSDSRMPVDKDEVLLRRTIGLKKDEYFLNGKNIPKGDVMNLLESAGFSRSNPYYIVQQGKINALALAKDSARFDLLKEVAGTTVFDERREETLRIMEETQSRRENINEVMEYMDARLSDLEQDTEEYKAYQQLDRTRRCLEYTIHNNDMQEVRAHLEQIEMQRQVESDRNREQQQAERESATALYALESEIRSVEADLSHASGERATALEDAEEAQSERTRLNLRLADLRASTADGDTQERRLRNELTTLDETIAAKQTELDNTIEPRFRELLTAETDATETIANAERRVAELYAKQGRGRQFKTTAARDKWINAELPTLRKTAQEKEKTVTSLGDDVAALEQKIPSLTERLELQTAELEKQKGLIDGVKASLQKHTHDKDTLNQERKELWRQHADINAEVLKYQAELSKAERDLQSTMRRDLLAGVEAVEQIRRDGSVEGIFGPLIELFESHENFTVPIEVTAGNALFNIVVDTDATAGRVLAAMSRHKMPGRVTFMPLNRLDSRTINYPNTADALPLVKQLRFDPRFTLAMNQVFGKTLVCRNLDVASQFAKSENLNCITLEGDQVLSKGALRGGYIDSKSSRIETVERKRKFRHLLETKQSEAAVAKGQADEKDQGVTKLMGELQKAETQQSKLRISYENLRQEIKALNEESRMAQNTLKKKRAAHESASHDWNRLVQEMDALKAELGTALVAKLAADDHEEVLRLTDQIAQQKSHVAEQVSLRAQAEREKQALESLLADNLQRRRSEIVRLLSDLDNVVGDNGPGLGQVAEDAAAAEIRCETLAARLKTLEEAAETLTARRDALAKQLTELKGSLTQQEGMQQQRGTEMEGILRRRQALLKRKEELVTKVRELGALPNEAFEMYQKESQKSLYEQLRRCNESLKQYSHVNQKALDQYVSFCQQRQQLIQRKTEIDAGDDAIRNLITVLDNRKSEAIATTFKQVQSYFAEVFTELVPGGRAQLVLVRREEEDAEEPLKKGEGADDEEEDDEEEEGEGDEEEEDNEGAKKGGKRSRKETASKKGKQAKKPKKKKMKTTVEGSAPANIDAYTGVAIKVAFNASSGETHMLQQLSGGQKSIVALAMIFAIQRCDPAPFYLFDEIDQALDDVHRTAVAKMIHRLSEKAQFITTTFRPELLENADKCYAITYHNKVSHVNCVNKQSAVQFVGNDEAGTK